MEQTKTFDLDGGGLGENYEALEGLSLKLMAFCTAAGLALLMLGVVIGASLASRAYIAEQERLEMENLSLRTQVWQEQAVRRILERNTP